MKETLQNYREHVVTVDGRHVVFFYNSGLCLDQQPRMNPYSHSHFHSEIFTVFRGEMEIVTDDGSIKVSAGETAFIPNNLTHKTVYCGDIFRVVIAMLNPDDTSTEIMRTLTGIATSDRISVYKNPHFREVMSRLLRYEHDDYDHKDILIEACLTELCALICQSKNSAKRSFENFSDSKNYRNYLLEAIFYNAFSPMSNTVTVPTLKQVSEQLHLSEKQTARTVKAFFGRGFYDQVVYMKMNKAAELLCKTDMTVNAIAAAVGYSVTRGFFTSFKKRFGMTPNEYRAEKSKQ